MREGTGAGIDPVLIETLADRSWPAAEVAPLGPWTLRATEGVTRRANSVFTAGREAVAGDDLQRLVEAAEAFYERRGLPPCFQISAATATRHLDGLLAARGYEASGESEVWTAAVGELVGQSADGAAELKLSDEADDAWFGCAFDEPADRRRIHEQIVRRVAGPRCFASAVVGGEVAGCGMAVAERGHVGLFCMSTREAYRRRGIGTSLVRRLCEWGAGPGARRAYLQVMTGNEAAKGLYRRAGFAFAYGYHYRMR